MSDRWTRDELCWLVVLALALLGLSLLTGCAAPANARSLATAQVGVEAAIQVNADPELDAQDRRQRINRLLHTSMTAMEPALEVLSGGEEVSAPISAEEAAAAPERYEATTAPVVEAAWQEAEDRAWWRQIGRTVMGWVDVALESTLGITLGGLGGGLGIAGIAAKIMGYRRKIKTVAERIAEWQDRTEAGGEIGDRAGDMARDLAEALGPREVERRRRQRAPSLKKGDGDGQS